MKKIEKQMIEAIKSERNMKLRNMHILKNYGIIEVWLYDTKIAEINHQKSYISLWSGGHKTVTTKSRLNTILLAFTQYKLRQIDFDWYLITENAKNLNRSFYDGMTIHFGD